MAVPLSSSKAVAKRPAKKAKQPPQIIPNRAIHPYPEAAILIGVGITSVRLFVNQGKLKAKRIMRGRVGIERAEIDRFLADCPDVETKPANARRKGRGHKTGAKEAKPAGSDPARQPEPTKGTP